MTVFYVDVSQYDRDRRGAPLDWGSIGAAGLPAVMVARASYGDPQIYSPPTRYFAEHQAGALAAGYIARGGYHNLIRGDQASIDRQVDYLRGELDANEATWGMADVEPYQALRDNGLWPRFEDAQRFHDRWYAVEQRVLAWYIGRWVWSGWLGSPDLTGLEGPLINAHYGPVPAGAQYADIYAANGGDVGPGWEPYGGRVPDMLQFTSKADVPGASSLTDVNAHRGTLAHLQLILLGGTMTFAPLTLQEPRRLLLDHLDMHPTSAAYPADLDPAEVGIVGDAAHVAVGTSYHLGKDQLRADAYSRRTARDIAGLSNAASAIDIGQFTIVTARGTFTHRSLAAWSVRQCQANHVDTRDIREIIYSPDGVNVLHYDRELGVTSVPHSHAADSHRWHDHYSRYRDGEFRTAFTDHFGRWLTEIGEGVTMGTFEEVWNTDGITNPYADKATNPTIQAETALHNIARDSMLTNVRVATLSAKMDQVIALLAAGGGTGGGPSIEQIRAVVDEELDEQSRAGADTDA